MAAREWLHGQMDPLVSLKIVVAIEGLWALVTLEWSVILLLLLPWMRYIHIVAHVLLRIAWHVHSAHHLHLVAGTVHIGHDRTTHRRQGIWRLVRPLVLTGRGLHRLRMTCRNWRYPALVGARCNR